MHERAFKKSDIFPQYIICEYVRFERDGCKNHTQDLSNSSLRRWTLSLSPEAALATCQDHNYHNKFFFKTVLLPQLLLTDPCRKQSKKVHHSEPNNCGSRQVEQDEDEVQHAGIYSLCRAFLESAVPVVERMG